MRYVALRSACGIARPSGIVPALLSAGLGVLSLTSSLAGCVTDSGGWESLPEADYEWFVTEVQPILAVRCGSPGCHGNLARPLQIYSVHQHRLEPEDVHLDTPLSEEELSWNFNRAGAFLMDLERAGDALLLLKPLAPEAGGADHGGGTQFTGTRDYEYQVLHAWIDDSLTGGTP